MNSAKTLRNIGSDSFPGLGCETLTDTQKTTDPVRVGPPLPVAIFDSTTLGKSTYFYSSSPLEVCLHKRDFIPGKWIIDNIIDSIEKSHKTIFVLSENFVRGEWCKYELDFSHFRLFDENDDAAILILLEPIEKKAIPSRKGFS
nr:toll-like receptor 2 [Kogia breviceps]